jgi:hypothetical protein
MPERTSRKSFRTKTTANPLQALPTAQLFTVGSVVYEKVPSRKAIHEIGVVLETYEFDSQHRYVVEFESGRENIFFENELIADYHG